jgi:hypothetical protein
MLIYFTLYIVNDRPDLSSERAPHMNKIILIYLFVYGVFIVFLIGMGADKSLAFPISYFPICSTTKRIVLEWVKEVRTKKP